MMKVGDLVRTFAGLGIIVEYEAKWEKEAGGSPWYVWMTNKNEVYYFKACELEVVSESR
jgi:hypothetical protein